MDKNTLHAPLYFYLSRKRSMRDFSAATEQDASFGDQATWRIPGNYAEIDPLHNHLQSNVTEEEEKNHARWN